MSTVVVPRVGAGPFTLGMTREQAWSQTRSVVTSFHPQTWSAERADDFRDHAIHAEYDDGVIVRLVAFTSNRPYASRCAVTVFEQQLGPECDRQDIVALLELQELEYVEGSERIDVSTLGLTFGFVERGEDGPGSQWGLEWISAEAAGRASPFTESG